jgi:flagellar hook-length control protein FliK
MAQPQTSRIPIGEARSLSNAIGRAAEAKAPREASEKFSAALDQDWKSRRTERPERQPEPENTRTPSEKKPESHTAESMRANKASLVAQRPPQIVDTDENTAGEIDLDLLMAGVETPTEPEADIDIDIDSDKEMSHSASSDVPQIGMNHVATEAEIDLIQDPSFRPLSDLSQAATDSAKVDEQLAASTLSGPSVLSHAEAIVNDATATNPVESTTTGSKFLSQPAKAQSEAAGTITDSLESRGSSANATENPLNAESTEISDVAADSKPNLGESDPAKFAQVPPRNPSHETQREEQQKAIDKLEQSQLHGSQSDALDSTDIDSSHSDAQTPFDKRPGAATLHRALAETPLATEQDLAADSPLDSNAVESLPTASPLQNDLSSSQNLNPQFMGHELQAFSTEAMVSNQTGTAGVIGTPESSATYQNLESISEQIALKLTGDDQTLVVELDPRDLGKLEIVVSNENGQLRIHINASEASTGALFERHRDALLDFMAAQGIEFSSLNLSSGGEERNDSFPFERQPENKYATNEPWSESPYDSREGDLSGSFSSTGKLNLKV